jgi:hypothetical protein
MIKKKKKENQNSEVLDVVKSKRISGEVKIIQKFKDGSVIERKLENIIVDNATIILARLLKNDTVNGLTHLAIGIGDLGWDPQNPPAASHNQTQLNSELYRKAFTSTRYISGGGGTSPTPTNVIELETVYDYGEANGALMEMGMFGIDATNTLQSGMMFNARNFAVINKDTSSTLTFVWRISIL